MSSLIINEYNINQSEGEVAIYNSVAAFANAINSLMKNESTRAWVELLPLPKVFEEHFKTMQEAKQRERQAQLAQAQEKAKQELEKAKSENIPVAPEVVEAMETIPAQAIAAQDKALTHYKKPLGRPRHDIKGR